MVKKERNFELCSFFEILDLIRQSSLRNIEQVSDLLSHPLRLRRVRVITKLMQDGPRLREYAKQHSKRLCQVDLIQVKPIFIDQSFCNLPTQNRKAELRIEQSLLTVVVD